MADIVKKAIIPIAGIGARFLPLSKILPKELWPLVDKPIIQYIVEEAKNSGITEIIFVINSNNKFVLDYFEKSPEIEKLLEKTKKEDLLTELKKLENLCQGLIFSYVIQRKPLGCGNAILQAESKTQRENVAVLFNDDIVESKVPCLAQLLKVFKTCQRPVIALCQMPNERLSSYGVVKVEKIANKIYKIKEIVEKPKIENTPSNLAIVGKYIITSEVFDYLKKTPPHHKTNEIILAESFNKMLKDGKPIYGYEFEGRWLECGNKSLWLKSFFYLSLKDQRYGTDLKKYLKEL